MVRVVRVQLRMVHLMVMLEVCERSERIQLAKTVGEKARVVSRELLLLSGSIGLELDRSVRVILVQEHFGQTRDDKRVVVMLVLPLLVLLLVRWARVEG